MYVHLIILLAAVQVKLIIQALAQDFSWHHMVAPLIGALRLAPIVSSDITYSWHCGTFRGTVGLWSWDPRIHGTPATLHTAWESIQSHTDCHSDCHRQINQSPQNLPFLEKCIQGGKHFSALYDFLLEWRKQVREVNVGNGSPQSFGARRWDNFVLPIPHLHGGHWIMDIMNTSSQSLKAFCLCLYMDSGCLTN